MNLLFHFLEPFPLGCRLSRAVLLFSFEIVAVVNIKQLQRGNYAFIYFRRCCTYRIREHDVCSVISTEQIYLDGV
jgi:hypothetical protein